jgi:hypothetical protein
VRKLSVRTVPSNSEVEEDVPPPPPPPDVALAAAESSAQLTLVVLLLLLLVPVLLFDVLGKGHPCASRYVWAARQLEKLLPKLMNTSSMVVEVQNRSHRWKIDGRGLEPGMGEGSCPGSRGTTRALGV